MQLEPPTLHEGVGDDFFQESDGSDPWSELEDRAGRRRRLLEVTGVVWLVMAVLLATVAIIGVPHRSRTGLEVARRQIAAAQNKANFRALQVGCPAIPTTPLHAPQFVAPTQVVAPGVRYEATVLTTAGTFRIALAPLLAPRTVNSFVFLADLGYFNCNTFERVVRGGYDVTGDPTGTGVGSPGYTLPAEKPWPNQNPKKQYQVGSVALANTGIFDGGGSQWFVVTGPKGSALPNSYSLFGRVISGMSVLQGVNREGSETGKPAVTQRILSVTIQSRA
jgi:cyclophilin family peptidyl-prolyl cis-trans isomerase